MRIYLSAGPADLRRLAHGEPVRAEVAYAVTRALAHEYPDADEEELEFAAMSAAADDCTGDTAIVIAADAEVSEATEPGVVVPGGEIPLDRVASFHIGTAPDDDLAWYATQELDALVSRLADP